MTTEMKNLLKSIEVDLRQPFPCEVIKFKPKQSRQNPKTKHWECLALPYADKRVYEDRLNALAFGAWSTPYAPPIVAGNKLVVPVTVILYGVAHTDVGESFLSSTTRKGDIREEENSAAEAYSQAFRRACSQFGLGRYLYQLPKLWLPYDAATLPFLPEGERIAWVEKLYSQAGLLPSPAHQAQHNRPTPPAQGHRQSNAANDTAPGAAPQTAQVSTASPTSPKSPTPSPTPQPTSQPAPSQQRQRTTIHTVERVDVQLLTYLHRALDAEQAKKACHYYHVNDLADLTPQQALHLSGYIEQQQKKTPTTGSRA
jgi:hypothetical protein